MTKRVERHRRIRYNDTKKTWEYISISSMSGRVLAVLFNAPDATAMKYRVEGFEAAEKARAQREVI
jgi:hypothetical protein